MVSAWPGLLPVAGAGLLSLLLPLPWAHAYIPTLPSPAAFANIIDSPVPLVS
jgi:hypothetical protein